MWQWRIDGFGEMPPETGTDDDQAVQFDLRYPGQQWDEETGLAYNLHRFYDPETGRYLQADPIGLVGGWNRFLYVEGNPLGLVDPRGLQSITQCGNPANAAACAEASMGNIRPLVVPIPVPKTCPDDECDPPAGTVCWELHDSGSPHEMSDSQGNRLPPGLPHYHTWQMNNSPIKGCTWNKRKKWKYTFPNPPSGTAACQLYPSWINKGGR